MGIESFACFVIITTISRAMVKKHGMLSQIYNVEHGLSLTISERKHPYTKRQFAPA